MLPTVAKTKIIATIGPASSTKEIINMLIVNGANVFRLNFSHGNHEQHKRAIYTIRSESSKLKKTVAIVADLQGPKIRIGMLPESGITLRKGAQVIINTEDKVGTEKEFSISYRNFANDVKENEILLIDDGKIELKVVEIIDNKEVNCEVLHGGLLVSRKGVNLPNTDLKLPSLTSKDINDVKFILENDVDWIALSFVRKVEDVTALKKLLKKNNSDIRVISKIEKPEALTEIDNIIDASDGIMIARGDLGVEMPFNEVPFIQKQLVNKCILKAKPVIIATQMLESMVNNYSPTRAETNDVANAVIDGADALMLSAETSVGKYPVESVRNMHQIIKYYEQKSYNYHRNNAPDNANPNFIASSICLSAQKLAAQTNAKALITFTHSGTTAIQISSYRPKATVYTFTDNPILNRQLALVWGIVAIDFSLEHSSDEFFEKTTDYLKSSKYIKSEDIIIHIGSIPLTDKMRTNMLKITELS